MTSLCDRTFPGWSHDVTVRNWACIRGQKQGPSMPKTHRVKLADVVKVRYLATVEEVYLVGFQEGLVWAEGWK